MPTRFNLAIRTTLLALCAGGLASPSMARCINEETPAGTKGDPATVSPADANASRKNLRDMVAEAIKRSQAVGAATLLAEAAVSDVQEARAGGLPQAWASGGLGYANEKTQGFDAVKGGQASIGLSVGAPLYDAGRVTQLTSWRTHLAEAALLQQMSAQEQVALQTVSLALDRNRYRLQVQVYQQYARRMSCLVQALEQIVNADKGRTSELVQARKNQQQAELSQAQALTSLRQTEVRLRRFVGDKLPPADGLSAVMIKVPELNDLLANINRASDILSLQAQAEASESLSQSVAAGYKPQIGWQLGANHNKGPGSGSATTAWSAGITYSIPLYSAAHAPAVDSARKRAQASRMVHAEALEARQFRTTDIHDQAVSSFDRARKVCDILRNSELVRNYTLQQWQQLGRRSLFDVMASEGDHYSLRVSYVNAMADGQIATALLHSLGAAGVASPLQ